MVCVGIAGSLVTLWGRSSLCPSANCRDSPVPAIPIKDFQNAKFAGSVANDRKVLLGSVGSDLWRGSSDAAGEFWMVTDRGPNGQIRVDGANRRTFWVPEFNPTIVRVKLEGSAIKIVEAVPIVGRSGKPITGLPNCQNHR